jgi:hypothetical protein
MRWLSKKQTSISEAQITKIIFIEGGIMGCGCRGGGGSGGGVRGVGSRPITTPRGRTAIVPRGLGPTELRQIASRQATGPTHFSAQRREIERKRRLAIQQSLGR